MTKTNRTLQKQVKNGIYISARLFAKIAGLIAHTRVGTILLDEMFSVLNSRTRSVTHNGVSLKFFVPNDVSLQRANMFVDKEPETLQFIDTFARQSVLWDIGANIGAYSLYAAKQRDCVVYAFEPSVFNLDLLARNVWLNNLSDSIILIPLPLTEKLMLNKLNMSTTVRAGATSTFGESYTHDGHTLNKVFEFSTLGLSMNEAVSSLKLQQPNYIKIDVDGIEHLILKGAAEVLQGVKAVLIEVNEKFETQANETSRYLTEAGFILQGKYPQSFNQIWIRPIA